MNDDGGHRKRLRWEESELAHIERSLIAILKWNYAVRETRLLLADQLHRLTTWRLVELAARYGVDTAQCRTKLVWDIVNAILHAYRRTRRRRASKTVGITQAHHG